MTAHPAQIEIDKSGAKGVWIGYIRQTYGEEVVNDILKDGVYVKEKRADMENYPNDREGMLWAIYRAK